jgi:hypothetical protein
MNFEEMRQADVPHGRNGKHKDVVTKILSDLGQTEKGVAIKEKVRSALNRATRKNGQHVATASDDTFLYVWNVTL